jgi:hypothetical protein
MKKLQGTTSVVPFEPRNKIAGFSRCLWERKE